MIRISSISRSVLPLLLTALVGLIAVVPAFASDVAIPTTPNGAQEAATPEASEKGLELTLEQAIVYALRHNLALVVERYGNKRSLLGIGAAHGMYDLGLTGQARTSSSQSPTTSTLQVVDGNTITNDTDSWFLQLDQLTPWGGGVQFSVSGSESETSDQTQFLNPLYSVNSTLGFRQPLLRGFGRDITERDIVVARRDADISHEAFRSQVESIVQQVSDTYWNLVQAKEQLAVAQESLELAKELHEMNRIQVDVGTKAPLEMVESEAGVAVREEDIIRRQAQVEDDADNLRRLTNMMTGTLWDAEILPITDPEIEHRPIDVGEAVAQALEHRVDVRQQRLALETRRLDAEVAQNNTLPSLDVTAGLGYNGIAGTVSLPGVPPVEEGYGDAFSQVTSRDFETWSVTVDFTYPIQNRQAKARAAQADLFVEEGEWALKDLESQVLVEVRRAARGVDTAAKAIDSAKVSSRLARKNLEARQKRYENGLSTSFEVLQIQEDLSEALTREVTAVIGYRQALVAYQRAIGRLLDEHDIELDGEE